MGGAFRANLKRCNCRQHLCICTANAGVLPLIPLAFVILGRSRSEATCADPRIHAVTAMTGTTAQGETEQAL